MGVGSRGFDSGPVNRTLSSTAFGIATATTFLHCPGANAEMGPATRYTLRRNTASIMKI